MAMIKSIGRELWSSQGPWGRKEDKGGGGKGQSKECKAVWDTLERSEDSV